MPDEKSYLVSLEAAVKAIRKSGAKEAVVIHHDEADGITSGSLAKKALEGVGFRVSVICTDKLFPEIITSQHKGGGRLIAYADIGAAHVRRIASENSSRNLTIILDHHDTESCDDPSVHNLDPELYGFSGEREASSATVAYLFAKAMDQQNRKLAHLAVIGSAEIPGPLLGLNRNALQDALSEKLVDVKGEEIKILTWDRPLSYKRASTLLSVLGSVGYYHDGPKIGIDACLEGFDAEKQRTALELEERRKEANKKLLSRLRTERIQQLKNTQWFHARDAFRGMSTKVIGSFCSYLSFQRIVNPARYLVGFMDMEPEIPGFGRLPKEYVKCSARCPKILASLVEKNAKPPLSKILPQACTQHGGFGDGHAVAASGVVLKGKESEFMQTLDSLAG